MWILSFLTLSQTGIQRLSTFSLCTSPVMNRMSFLWGKNSELVDAQKLRLNSGVCAAVHFSGDRVHNFYQMKMGTP